MLHNRLTQFCVLISIAFGVATIANSEETGANLLEKARWESRLILICGAKYGAVTSDLFKAQREEVDWSGYLDRDLDVIGVTPDDAILLNTEELALGLTNTASLGFFEPQPDLIEAAECKESVPSITLVGKDGGVKKRWDGPVSNAELFALIDAMPMRQSEMERGK